MKSSISNEEIIIIESNINIIFLIFLFLEFGVNINLGYIEQGELVTKRNLVIKHYIQKSLLLDLFVVLGILLSFTSPFFLLVLL